MVFADDLLSEFTLAMSFDLLFLLGVGEIEARSIARWSAPNYIFCYFRLAASFSCLEVRTS